MSVLSFISRPSFYIPTFTLLIGGALGFFTGVSIDSQAQCVEETRGIVELPKAEADKHIKVYREVRKDSIWGVSVSVEEWKAINKTIVDKNCDLSNVGGFKLYYGLDTMGIEDRYFAFCYAIDKQYGTERSGPRVNTVENFDVKYSDPCPHFCD